MNKTLLTIALLTAISAQATDYSPLTQQQFQQANGGSANTGNVTVGGWDGEKNPVSSAIAPSITQNAICPIITPNSHAFQVLVFGGSTTGGQSLNAECVAWHLGQRDVLERMTCDKSAEYRKANKACK